MNIKVTLALMMMLLLPMVALGADAPESKPPAKPPESAAAKADLKSLQGVWRVVRAENNGADVKDRLGYEQFTVEGNTVRVVRNGEERKSSFELDPSHDPKWINFTTPRGDQSQGIYELKADTWRTMSSGRGRPATFEDAGAALFVYERVKQGAAAAATKPATKPATPAPGVAK
jgi:uncharacterized protein (TIGR03067 family)